MSHKFSSHSVFYCICLVSFFIFACGMAEKPGKDVVIMVGSSHITADKLKEDIKFMSAGIEIPAQQREGIKDQIIGQCINHYLIMEYGKKNNITLPEVAFQHALNDVKKEYTDTAFDEALLRGYVDIDQWEGQLKEQLLEKKIIGIATERISAPNYEDIKQYFESNQDEFKSPKMIEFRQIVTRTKKEAKDLRTKLRNGEHMEALAKKYSIAPEAENGGNVGWVAKGHLNESMEKALFSMKKGQISKVIETPYGYHIFEVLSVKSAGPKKLPDVIDEIKSRLLLQKHEAFINKWVQDLRNTFEVKINKDMINKLEFS